MIAFILSFILATGIALAAVHLAVLLTTPPMERLTTPPVEPTPGEETWGEFFATVGKGMLWLLKRLPLALIWLALGALTAVLIVPFLMVANALDSGGLFDWLD